MSREDKNIWEGNTSRAESDYIRTAKTGNASALDIDIRRILGLWPFILLFGLLGFAVGSIYLRYITPIYTLSTSISIEDKAEISLGQALLGSARDPFNDRIEYFKSPTLAAKLVDSLGLQYNAVSQGRFKNKDFYGIIRWEILTLNNQEPEEINFSILPNKTGFKYNAEGKIQGDAAWSVPFRIGKNTIVVHKLKNFGGFTPIYCYNVNKLITAFNLSGGLAVTTTKESNVLTVRYADISAERAIDILNGLTKIHNEAITKDKSLGFLQAINFIEGRMEPLRNELDSIENSLAAFKASRGMVGASANGEMYLQKVQNYDNELTRISIMESTIKSVEDFINNPKLNDADLSFVGVENAGLQGLLSQYQQMRMQREKLALTAQETNPTVILIDKNLADLKSNMENQIRNYKANLRIAQNTYSSKIADANSMLRGMPLAEKELMDKTRFQNIKEALYLTLLQKREEAYIAKASITVDSKVIYPPLKNKATIKPSKVTILFSFILVGLLLPIFFAIIKEITNKKIISKKQLQNITNIPIIAELEQVQYNETFPFVIGGNNRSMFGEQIRTLRTNINFFLNAEKSTHYILLTSNVSGEGKSFLSMNIAKSYSLQGKKVALLEFDLRRPKISKAIGIEENKIGLTSLLTGKYKAQEIKVTIVDDEKEKFDLFPSGSVPPNPQELITNKYMLDLKAYLDAHYDVVVIDSPPYGIVADAQILGQWADLTLIVTRFNQTIKEQVVEIEEWKESGIFKSVSIIFNGVKNSGYFGYKYGYYYYKRKYGYGYYSSYIGGEKKKKDGYLSNNQQS
jgi:capsular exopolysaccharide synthesis family protein